ncbi:hypothetical protein MBM_00362 [Drepanopeziza brunnea f. sp. 'multigermtubi' MB_m1]|uniref:Uncharacterized protein n=1 Tax=Marssonina brunnea f. sp. multigermtubi (strain MB_m1) TaxID=1072389 RepID=K1Y801_MARBU|nr:uncharacterized protein MBM_00362 [Drepanopeziza brunnea f. sp. 'multigermtubi' MB_m1]EKD21249.1 hypothetical protein MBM_00362 [Drepanopeziza brunnea f. sp. 'multigermtubi' MB_m1]
MYGSNHLLISNVTRGEQHDTAEANIIQLASAASSRSFHHASTLPYRSPRSYKILIHLFIFLYLSLSASVVGWRTPLIQASWRKFLTSAMGTGGARLRHARC